MISHGAVLFSEPALDRQHFLTGGTWVAVDTGNKALHDLCIFIIDLLCLFAVYRILDNIGQSLRLLCGHILFFVKCGVCGLVRVLHIDDHFTQPAIDTPDRCGSHYKSIGCGDTTASVIFLTASSKSLTPAS